eukprot:SM000178S03453  [mRNA]  locus=s178:152569:159014:+ [translate_table: standard]
MPRPLQPSPPPSLPPLRLAGPALEAAAAAGGAAEPESPCSPASLRSPPASDAIATGTAIAEQHAGGEVDRQGVTSAVLGPSLGPEQHGTGRNGQSSSKPGAPSPTDAAVTAADAPLSVVVQGPDGALYVGTETIRSGKHAPVPCMLSRPDAVTAFNFACEARGATPGLAANHVVLPRPPPVSGNEWVPTREDILLLRALASPYNTVLHLRCKRAFIFLLCLGTSFYILVFIVGIVYNHQHKHQTPATSTSSPKNDSALSYLSHAMLTSSNIWLAIAYLIMFLSLDFIGFTGAVLDNLSLVTLHILVNIVITCISAVAALRPFLVFRVIVILVGIQLRSSIIAVYPKSGNVISLSFPWIDTCPWNATRECAGLGEVDGELVESLALERYRVCLFCYERIKLQLHGLCPSCRTPYGTPQTASPAAAAAPAAAKPAPPPASQQQPRPLPSHHHQRPSAPAHFPSASANNHHLPTPPFSSPSSSSTAPVRAAAAWPKASASAAAPSAAAAAAPLPIPRPAPWASHSHAASPPTTATTSPSSVSASPPVSSSRPAWGGSPTASAAVAAANRALLARQAGTPAATLAEEPLPAVPRQREADAVQASGRAQLATAPASRSNGFAQPVGGVLGGSSSAPGGLQHRDWSKLGAAVPSKPQPQPGHVPLVGPNSGLGQPPKPALLPLGQLRPVDGWSAEDMRRASAMVAAARLAQQSQGRFGEALAELRGHTQAATISGAGSQVVASESVGTEQSGRGSLLSTQSRAAMRQVESGAELSGERLPKWSWEAPSLGGRDHALANGGGILTKDALLIKAAPSPPAQHCVEGVGSSSEPWGQAQPMPTSKASSQVLGHAAVDSMSRSSSLSASAGVFVPQSQSPIRASLLAHPPFSPSLLSFSPSPLSPDGVPSLPHSLSVSPVPANLPPSLNLPLPSIAVAPHLGRSLSLGAGLGNNIWGPVSRGTPLTDMAAHQLQVPTSGGLVAAPYIQKTSAGLWAPPKLPLPPRTSSTSTSLPARAPSSAAAPPGFMYRPSDLEANALGNGLSSRQQQQLWSPPSLAHSSGPSLLGGKGRAPAPYRPPLGPMTSLGPSARESGSQPGGYVMTLKGPYGNGFSVRDGGLQQALPAQAALEASKGLECPVCQAFTTLSALELNEHMDLCLHAASIVD